MPQQKSYAIRCTTEEQARECIENDLLYVFWCYPYIDKNGIPIISYDEAISLGLLGEKKGESPSEDIVEKIVQEWIGTHGENRAIYWREMEKILKKFLSK